MSAARTERDATEALREKARMVEKDLLQHVCDRGRLAVIQAPPGSGKTWLLLKAVEAAYKAKRRVAIATQTNSQADDICRRLVREYPALCATRFAGSGSAVVDFGSDRITRETQIGALPPAHCIVIATAAKWGVVTIVDPFDVVFIEESWQLGWADFMLLGQVAERFVMIGDPGQIPPVVTVDVARWETAPRPPHRAAPQVLLEDPSLKHRLQEWRLPGTRRLPHDTAAMVRAFYDFNFDAFAAPDGRAILAEKGGKSAADQAIDLLRMGSAVGLTVPTPDAGPPLEVDEDLAELAVDVVKRLLARDARVKIDGTTRKLLPQDIGMVATHRVMNSTLDLALPKELRGKVVVDTPERWQGLERPVMLVVHPLSGVVRPSTFDLETGRLCVMASRHQAGMIVLSRDHIGETLRSFIPMADQPLGRRDVAGRGLYDNESFWGRLESGGRVVAA
jgi:hypothetical protein